MGVDHGRRTHCVRGWQLLHLRSSRCRDFKGSPITSYQIHAFELPGVWWAYKEGTKDITCVQHLETEKGRSDELNRMRKDVAVARDVANDAQKVMKIYPSCIVMQCLLSLKSIATMILRLATMIRRLTAMCFKKLLCSSINACYSIVHE